MATTNNNASVLGNLASVDINIKIAPLTVFYIALLILLSATSVYLVKKYS